MTYTYWNKGQPDNNNNLEDRIHICKYDNVATTGIQTYGWNDHTSEYTGPFICEKKADVKDVFGK